VADGASLVSEFEAVQVSQWHAKVDETRPGTAGRLCGETEDGLAVAALYTAADARPTLPGSVGADTLIGRAHQTGDVVAVAAAAVADTARGVQTSWVRLAPAQRAGCTVATGGPGVAVDTDGLRTLAGCGATVMIEAGAAASSLLRALPADHGIAGVLAAPIACLAETGGSGLSADNAMARVVTDTAWAIDHQPGVATALLTGVPFHDAGATDVQEVGLIVAQGLALLEACEHEGLSAADVAKHVVLHVAVGHAPFAAVAKLRAVRSLWSSVVAAAQEGAAVGDSSTSVLWAQSSARTRTQRDVANNLLRATLEAFAAATGGADGALIVAHTHALGAPDDDAVRLAVNAQLLMRDESGLSRVSDPAAGSWAVESRTRALASKAWAYATQLHSNGGVVQALADGTLQREVSDAARERALAVARRQVPITGVSIFPDLGDCPAPSVSGAAGQEGEAEAAVTVIPLTPQRLPEPLEQLRDAADAAAERPRAVLVRLGAAPDVRAQLDFATGVLAAGGISVQAVGPDLSDADLSQFAVAVLCGTPDHIAGAGAVAVAAVKQAGVARIVVAGKPGDHESELAAAGVDEYVHRGSDIVTLLRGLHRVLGVGGAA